ncbi:MAG: 4Fe-4S binding protein [Bdellovibrionota bacterium]
MSEWQKWLPVIDENLCTGCNQCIEACGPACLELDKQIAVLARAATCGSEEHCVGACPENAIRMEWIPQEMGASPQGYWRHRKAGSAWNERDYGVNRT